MMRFLFLLASLLFAGMGEAQNLLPYVVNSGGAAIHNNAHTLEWSLGELAITTLTSPDNLLTQGFFQPTTTTVTTKDIFSGNRFSVFPNPVSGWLNFRTDIPDIATVQVHDALGRLVLQRDFQPLLDLNQLKSGAYWVSLFGTQNQFLHAFKINKI